MIDQCQLNSWVPFIHKFMFATNCEIWSLVIIHKKCIREITSTKTEKKVGNLQKLTPVNLDDYILYYIIKMGEFSWVVVACIVDCCLNDTLTVFHSWLWNKACFIVYWEGGVKAAKKVLIETLYLFCCFRMHKVDQQCFKIYLQMDLYLRPWLILRYGIEA